MYKLISGSLSYTLYSGGYIEPNHFAFIQNNVTSDCTPELGIYVDNIFYEAGELTNLTKRRYMCALIFHDLTNMTKRMIGPFSLYNHIVNRTFDDLIHLLDISPLRSLTPITYSVNKIVYNNVSFTASVLSTFRLLFASTNDPEVTHTQRAIIRRREYQINSSSLEDRTVTINLSDIGKIIGYTIRANDPGILRLNYDIIVKGDGVIIDKKVFRIYDTTVRNLNSIINVRSGQDQTLSYNTITITYEPFDNFGFLSSTYQSKPITTSLDTDGYPLWLTIHYIPKDVRFVYL